MLVVSAPLLPALAGPMPLVLELMVVAPMALSRLKREKEPPEVTVAARPLGSLLSAKDLASVPKPTVTSSKGFCTGGGRGQTECTVGVLAVGCWLWNEGPGGGRACAWPVPYNA